MFIDSSTTSLKAALIYKNNVLPTILIAYANAKKDRSSIQKVLEFIDYSLGWLIKCDLKVLNFIMGVKICQISLLLLFDSKQSRLDFNFTHTWPARVDFVKILWYLLRRLHFLPYI